MAEESAVQLVDTATGSDLSVEALTAVGDAMSQALLFALGRNYLDGPIFQAGYVRLQDTDLPQQPDVSK